MYLKLRYRGQIQSPELVSKLTTETQDICDINGWKYHIWNEDWSLPADTQPALEEGALHFSGHAPLRGITFSPNTDTETIWLTFTSDGILHSLFTLSETLHTGTDTEYPWIRVKTGFDDTATHCAICHLFKYLSKQYFSTFDVLDESGYWEHGDQQQLSAFIASLETV